MTKPTTLPEWGTGPGASIVEPSAGRKELGWTATEEPPAEFFNWWQNNVFGWVEWLDGILFDNQIDLGTSADSESVVTFDTDDSLQYDKSGDSLGVLIGGSEVSRFGSDGLAVAENLDLNVGSGGFRLTGQGPNKFIIFNPGRTFQYSDSSDEFLCMIGGFARLVINSDGIEAGGSAEVTGSSTVYGARGVGARFTNNTITAACSIVSPSSPFPNGNQFNVSSVTRLAAGQYSVAYDRAYTVQPNALATPATAFGVNASIVLEPGLSDIRVYTFDNAGNAVDRSFSLLCVGGEQ